VSGSKRNLLHVLGQLRAVPKFDTMKLMNDNRSVAGVNTLHFFDKAPAIMLNEVREVVGLYERDALKPVIDQTVPFAEAPRAFRRLQEGKNIGKVLLVPF
jgi:synaptic vesicle membrane protein VAT-1